jgi:hypothetical protein
MFDFRHTIVKGRLRAFWEPGLFALPGVLFLWAGVVALHRVSLRGAEGSAVFLYGSIGILMIAGLCLAGGRAGVVFAPAEKRWGHWIGLFRPLVCRWRSLAPFDRVVVEREEAGGGEASYHVGLAGEKDVSLGATTDEPVAFSVAESLATFLRTSIALGGEKQTARTFSQPPLWGQLAAAGGTAGSVPKLRAEAGRVTVPLHIRALRGRGPILLAAFMAFVLYVSWSSEELGRSPWGIAASLAVVALCAWALAFGLNALLRRGTISCEKKELAIDVKGLWPARRSLAWPDIAYLALLPPKKGFLALAGRDARVVVGSRDQAWPIGESLRGDDIVGFYRYLVQQAKIYRR